MHTSRNISVLDRRDLDYVAHSVMALISYGAAVRLLTAGLIRKVDPADKGNAAVVITSEGKSVLRTRG